MIGLTRELIAVRVAAELREGQYVNLGTGIPTLVANFLGPEKDIMLQSENGVIGFGPAPEQKDWDIDLVNARAQPVTLRPGACFFDQAESFAMIRGGHLDVAVLGAYQVSKKGDLANWKTPRFGFGTVGGAMDLAWGAKRIIVAMEHAAPNGQPKILNDCTYPLTARAVVDTIITDLAVIEVTRDGLLLKEVAPGITPEQVQEVTEPILISSPDLREMAL